MAAASEGKAGAQTRQWGSRWLRGGGGGVDNGNIVVFKSGILQHLLKIMVYRCLQSLKVLSGHHMFWKRFVRVLRLGLGCRNLGVRVPNLGFNLR